MLRSLYSGVTGMKNLQTKMDVISNNIANVNTTSFKSGRVRFEDMISQTMAQADANINAKQIGLGVQVGSIDTVMGGGSLQSTGRDLDFAIENGDSSFFTVSSDGTDDELLFTRDGGFYLNADNQLVTASGHHLLGVMLPEASVYDESFNLADVQYNAETGIQAVAIPTTQDGETLSSYAIDSNGLVVGVYNGESYVLGQISLTNFSNAAGLEKVGANMYRQSANSGAAEIGAASQEQYGSIRSGFLEMSNVDLSNEFTELIVTNRAYQANSRSITTSDQMLEELLSLKR